MWWHKNIAKTEIYLFIYQAFQCFHIFLRPFNNYIFFFLQLLLSFHSSSINPFSPIGLLIPSAQVSLGLPREKIIYLLKYNPEHFGVWCRSIANSDQGNNILSTELDVLTHCGRVTQICVFTFQLCRTGDADLRF